MLLNALRPFRVRNDHADIHPSVRVDPKAANHGINGLDAFLCGIGSAEQFHGTVSDMKPRKGLANPVINIPEIFIAELFRHAEPNH